MKVFSYEIVVPHGSRQKLANAFGVGRGAVLEALRFRSNSELAKKIRTEAISAYHGKTVKYENA